MRAKSKSKTERQTAQSEFLRACNSNRRVRLFGPDAYQKYLASLRRARAAKRRHKPFYETDNAGEGPERGRTAYWVVVIWNGKVHGQYGEGHCSHLYGLTRETYLKMYTERWWYSPTYELDGHEVCVVADWRAEEGVCVGVCEMHLEMVEHHAFLACTRIPDGDLGRQLKEYVKGISWEWPPNTSESECLAIIEQRADEIVGFLPACAIVLASA